LEREKNALLRSNSELSSWHTTSLTTYEKSTSELREKEEEFYTHTKYSIDTIPENANYLKESKIIALGEDILRLRV
jgi:hypothetical protein